jgi:hypothetical protein
MPVYSFLPPLFGALAIAAALFGQVVPALLLALVTYTSDVILRRRDA